MHKIGLALSGGGFRASLYHLGLVRFLRDADILRQVTHITSVSGGSIFSAHLALNWDRYNGSPNEFDAAAAEFLSFVRLDVRNRIARRFLLNMPLRWPRRLLGRSNRKLTRTGLLEYHYEKFLYGDTSLFELPERPQLHLLSTNLSEGCLCSFNRNGLLMVRRQAGNTYRMDHIHIGLATVAMGVTASSAFPGFFPPLELTGAEVGASVGEFGRQAYTDGGVFDNLGVRMFRCLERPLLAGTPLCRDDFVDFPAAVEALREASQTAAETPLRRLAQLLVAACSRPDLLPLPNAAPASKALPPPPPGAVKSDIEDLLLSSLWNVLLHYQFQLDPLFIGLKPAEVDAEVLLQFSRIGGKVLDPADQLWLNRHLLEAAFRQATGQPCFRRLKSGLDAVLVSDVGKPIEVQSNRRAGGLIRTALRATDILMDRVWQLENETFHDTTGFLFAPITEVVDPPEDPTAPHPEIQRQTANIRTDLDRFSPLEISSLVRHGYCVGRKACRTRPDLFGSDLPANGPWDPVPRPRSALPALPAGKGLDGSSREPAPATVEARSLQASSLRRIWSTLLDYRDWVSYIYVPIIIPLLFLLPYAVTRIYHRSAWMSHIIDSLSQGSRDLEVMTALLEGPMTPWPAAPFEEVRTLEEPDYTGFEVLQDSRIIDMRAWDPSPAAAKNDARNIVYGYRRLKVLKLPENTDNNLFRYSLLAISPSTHVRFPPQLLPSKLRMCNVEDLIDGQRQCRWQGTVDFSKVPAGDFVDILYEHYSVGLFLRRGDTWTSMSFPFHVDTAEVTRWFLMPRGKEYRSYRILRYETDKPEKVEEVKVVTEYMANDASILAYKLMSVKAGYTYDVTWYYK